MGEIPGWEKIGADQLKLRPGAQLVSGQWYAPVLGCDSLQELIDEYMELLWSDYHFHTYVGKGGKRFGVVSDGDHAIRILKEWGKLDKKGNIIER